LNDTTGDSIQNDWDLYVVENVELELGLQDNEENKNKTSTEVSPLFLKRDPINEQRYFCYHDAGLHGITIGFVSQLNKYVADSDDAGKEENDVNLNLLSRAEYIISTKAFNTSKINAVVGFGVIQLPSGIFAIMSSGQIVSLNTMMPIINDYIAQSTSNIDSKPVTSQQPVKIPFDQHIKMILKSEVSQPILQLDKTKPPSSQQAFQLLMSSIQIMREKKFIQHDKARQEIIKRMKILELMKNQQKDEIAQLLQNKELIQEKAYKLADAYEDITERQQILQKRIQDISRLTTLKLPLFSSSEKEFSDNIKHIKLNVDKLLQNVKQIRAKSDVQQKAVENFSKTNEDFSRKSLMPKQEDAIKEFLNDMMRQIHTLKLDVQKIHNVVDY
jgi:nuclear pore complex protein Nup88